MYAAYFGLVELPFSITPDPRYLYMSAAHREALAHLLYGIGEGGGFVQLTGEVGTGKTTLCRCLLEQLPPRVDVAFLLNPKLTDIELLATICDELRIPYPAGTSSRKYFVDALHHHLLEAHGQGHRTVLIIDEAQDLAPDTLEQIRLLTNLETTTEKLLQIILIGQPELIALLERDDLRQIAQRVTARYHLLPVGQDDTRAYVLHRLAVAGQSDPIFTEPALRQVHHASRGVPRLINAICDRALLGAYTQDQHRVTAAIVRRAAREVLGTAPRLLTRQSRWWTVAAAGVAAAVLLSAPVLLARSELLPNRVRGWMNRPAAAPAPVGGSDARLADARPPIHPVLDPPTAAGAASARGSRGLADRPALLGNLLADPALRADKRSAFASLYARWGVDGGGARSALGCERARTEGLQCLFKTGTWAKLRRYNLPAILELPAPAGEHRYAALVGLEDDRATVEFGGRPYTVSLDEIERYWEGTFILLWRTPGVGVAASIAPGARGKEVEWVRQRLGELDGTPPSPRNRDLFDDELRARVVAFQRGRALVADGIVGEETLIHLSSALPDARIPRLGRAGS